jgi:hypothetical protein
MNGRYLEGSGHGLRLRKYHGILLEGLRKPMITHGEYSRPPGRDFNGGPAEY